MADSDETLLNIGLPRFPDDKLPGSMWGALSQIHTAIYNLMAEISRLTGLVATDPQYWPVTPPRSTIVTGNSTRLYMPANVNIADGQLVNLFDSGGGVMELRLADGGANIPAHGVATSTALAGQMVSAQWGACYYTRYNSLTPAALYYLSALIPGAITDVPPSTPGTLLQPVGLAYGFTDMIFSISLDYRIN